VIVSEAFKAHEVGDSPEGCRPFHGLDSFPNFTWGSAFGFTRLYSAARFAGLRKDLLKQALRWLTKTA
jgi:hypothetical protein